MRPAGKKKDQHGWAQLAALPVEGWGSRKKTKGKNRRGPAGLLLHSKEVKGCLGVRGVGGISVVKVDTISEQEKKVAHFKLEHRKMTNRHNSGAIT